MLPFRLHFNLSRRQRLAAELYPWLPCLAACLGFSLGVAFLSTVVSRWFLPLLVLPPLVARNFVCFLVDLALRPALPVEVEVSESKLDIRVNGGRDGLPLDGIIQVFRSGSAWTLLHLSGTVLTIPAASIALEQIEYLKGFARRAAQQRSEARGERADVPCTDL